MAVFSRAKRVTAPLDDEAVARLRGEITTSYASSSGSEHGSPCLSGLIHAYLESHDPPPSPDSDSDNAHDSSTAPTLAILRTLLNPPADHDRFRIRLLNDVSSAAHALAGLRPNLGPYRRAMMATLRAAGYNAGLCKARWESSGNLTAGSHEYIDVVVDSNIGGPAERYIVDVDFAGEFEIVRPTVEYARVLGELPRVMVARPEEVRRAVRAVAEAAQRSMRAQGLSVPPWRKGRYMLAKWVGPYRRTINPMPASGPAGFLRGGAEVKCRSVGFYADSGLVVPAAARTR